MERVAFLIEETGERLGCMLNPESLVLRRVAGLRPRRSAGGAVTGVGLSDDPLLFTGGGTTELQLDLLFDITLAGSSIVAEDVRQLTAPLWNLAENSSGGEATARPPKVRFVWGKNWNIPGIVSSIAERLEYFNADGLPRRSWIRLSLLRAADPPPPPPAAPDPLLDAEGAEPVPELQVAADEVAEGDVLVHEVTGDECGSGAVDGAARWDLIAWKYFQDCGLWKLLAEFNGIDDPADLRPGQALRIPPLSAVGGRS